MFCYQCQVAARNTGCTTKGVCGKTAEVAALQDLLIWTLKGLSFYGVRGRELNVTDPATDLFVAKAMFATITNVNFDAERFGDLIREALRRRDALRSRFEEAYRQKYGQAFSGSLPQMATWQPKKGDQAELIAQGVMTGIMAAPEVSEDIRSLRELLIYGLKGLAAYTDHAYVLDHTNDTLLHFMQEGLLLTTNDRASVDELVDMVLKCGQMGVQAMALLDQANTGTYGNPEPTWVNLGVKEGPAILVSGHDLRDLDELLQQTTGKGVNVYTHGEMLPANAYPAFKKYPHFVGNYGGSWWKQKA